MKNYCKSVLLVVLSMVVLASCELTTLEMPQTVAELPDSTAFAGQTVEPMHLNVSDTTELVLKAASSVSYRSIPSVGNYATDLSYSILSDIGTYKGGYFRAKVKSISGNKVTITIMPKSSLSFSESGTAYIKVARVNGTIAQKFSFIRGMFAVDLTFNATFPAGWVHFYPVVITSSGTKYVTQPVIIYTETPTSGLKFGNSYGVVNGVDAFSNGASGYASNSYNTTQGFNTGMKWQCVEFINRYYLIVYGLSIRISGNNANEYFNTASKRGLKGYSNGSDAPRIGDIICFSGGTYGHVGIVIEVGSSYVKIAHQNGGTTNPIGLILSKSGNTISASKLGSAYKVQGLLRKADGGN